MPHFASSVDGVVQQVGANLVQVQHQWRVAEALSEAENPTEAQVRLRQYFAAVMPKPPEAFRDAMTPMLRTDAVALLTLLPETPEEAQAVGMTADGASRVHEFHQQHPHLTE